MSKEYFIREVRRNMTDLESRLKGLDKNMGEIRSRGSSGDFEMQISILKKFGDALYNGLEPNASDLDMIKGVKRKIGNNPTPEIFYAVVAEASNYAEMRLAR